MMRSGVRVICRLGSGSDGPVIARRVISQELGEHVRAGKLEKVRLLASELVTDRVRRLTSERTMMLDLRAGDSLRCALVDDGAAALPTGWGAAFLDTFADAWGVTRVDNRTCTWFCV